MKPIFALILAAAPAAWAVDPVPMNLKTGQWEVTVMMQTNGQPGAGRPMPQIPPEQLARLPPEQRAKLEAAMAMASGAKPMVNKSCMKQEDLSRMRVTNNPANMQGCKSTFVTSSPAKQVIQMDCDRNGEKQSSTITVEALSPESYKFSMVSTGTANGAPVNMNINGTAKWLGPMCTDTK